MKLEAQGGLFQCFWKWIDLKITKIEGTCVMEAFKGAQGSLLPRVPLVGDANPASSYIFSWAYSENKGKMSSSHFEQSICLLIRNHV